MEIRKASINRNTKETQITLEVQLDGSGDFTGSTGIGFFDHMLTLLTFYSGMTLALNVSGDLETGSHHTVEDVGLALGTALKEAVGDKKGIARYSQCCLPMDEVLSRCCLDISGRPTYIQRAEFRRTTIGDLALEDIEEFLNPSVMLQIGRFIQKYFMERMIITKLKAYLKVLVDVLKRV